MKQVHIRVDDELYNELNSYSAKNELSMQDCVREAVAYYMSDVKKKKNTGKEKKFTFIDLLSRLTGQEVNVFIQANGINTVNKLILPTLESNRKEISQKLMLQIYQITIFWLPDFHVSLFR